MRLVAGNPSFIPLPVSGILSFFIDTRINPREKHLFCLCYDELIEHNIHSFYAICALLTIISLLQKSQEKWNFCSTLEGIWRVEVIRAVSHRNCVISINILLFKIILVIYQIPFLVLAPLTAIHWLATAARNGYKGKCTNPLAFWARYGIRSHALMKIKIFKDLRIYLYKAVVS